MKVPAFNQFVAPQPSRIRSGLTPIKSLRPNGFLDDIESVGSSIGSGIESIGSDIKSGVESLADLNWSCILSNAPELADHVSEFVEGVATVEDVEGGIQAFLAARGLSDDWDKIKQCFS